MVFLLFIIIQQVFIILQRLKIAKKMGFSNFFGVKNLSASLTTVRLRCNFDICTKRMTVWNETYASQKEAKQQQQHYPKWHIKCEGGINIENREKTKLAKPSRRGRNKAKRRQTTKNDDKMLENVELFHFF